ncbi:uncharacterized protein [Ptychodera flava]|uniref:uncharacterized protein n=1 Tax=Ptychodera flava TaxID=63121 RepID=UPI00396A4B5C
MPTTSFLVIFFFSLVSLFALKMFLNTLPYNEDHYEIVIGNYWAVVVPQLVSVQEVNTVLPQDLELIEDRIQNGSYMVLYTFGYQNKVQPVFGGISLHYLESIVAVPYVKFTPELEEKYGVNASFTFLPRLYLNDTWGIWLGRMYGMAKVKGHMVSDENAGSYKVSEYDSHDDIVQLSWKPSTTWKASENFPYSRQYIEGSIVLPLVAETRLGVYLSCIFDWKFPQSSVRGVQGKMEFHKGFMEGLPSGSFSFTGLEKGPLGAYEINTNWTLSFPFLSLHTWYK